MNKSIEVKCIESFDMFNFQMKKIAEVIEGKTYTAFLHEESEEYFAKDDKKREFLVGELDMGGKLILDEAFELVE